MYMDMYGVYVMRPRNNGFRPAVVVDAVILTLRSKNSRAPYSHAA